jgi:hypothetical protein
MAEGDLLPPSDPPVPNPPDRRPKSVTCDCCGCRLAGDGGVLQMGERARKLAKAEDTIDDLRGKLTKAESRIAELEARLVDEDDDDEDDW